MVVATADPETLPDLSTWYLTTNLARPGSPQAEESEFAPADLAEIVRLYGLRNWVEQGYKQVKHELGWADFMVRTDLAIRRHWALVQCAFSFCWATWFRTERVSESPPEQAELTVASEPSPEVQSAVVTSTEPESVEEEPWRWGKNEGQAREAGEGATRGRHLADGITAGARVAGPLGFALALVAGLVRLAPAAGTPSPSQLA